VVHLQVNCVEWGGGQFVRGPCRAMDVVKWEMSVVHMSFLPTDRSLSGNNAGIISEAWQH
jgi:hypothetical protein